MMMYLPLITVAVALLLVGGFAAFIALPDRLRRRRQESIRHQIALTDALDGALGPVVAPVVKRPFLGPWRIEIAAPLVRPATVGRALALAHRTLVAEGIDPADYRIVITARKDAARDIPEGRNRPATGRWADHPASV
jgi:hypothetical protein